MIVQNIPKRYSSREFKDLGYLKVGDTFLLCHSGRPAYMVTGTYGSFPNGIEAPPLNLVGVIHLETGQKEEFVPECQVEVVEFVAILHREEVPALDQEIPPFHTSEVGTVHYKTPSKESIHSRDLY
jgi:hypothetical protein